MILNIFLSLSLVNACFCDTNVNVWVKKKSPFKELTTKNLCIRLSIWCPISQFGPDIHLSIIEISLCPNAMIFWNHLEKSNYLGRAFSTATNAPNIKMRLLQSDIFFHRNGADIEMCIVRTNHFTFGLFWDRTYFSKWWFNWQYLCRIT